MFNIYGSICRKGMLSTLTKWCKLIFNQLNQTKTTVFVDENQHGLFSLENSNEILIITLLGTLNAQPRA